MTAAAPDDLPPPGTVLAGKYEVIRVLGKGGMGVVLEALHLRLQQSVAVKILLPSLRADEETTARFEREARAAAKLSGPNVARILDVDVLPDGSPIMVMELLRGVELGVELEQRGGKLPYREAVGYVLQALHAMDEAHRAGIVHRDLKPSNLFLCESDGKPTIKILDFGISKLAGDTNAKLTQTTTSFGTPLYMSPEQVRSTKLVDGRTDVWSLAVVLHELVAGHPPFNHPTPTAILAAIIADDPEYLSTAVPEVPPALSDAVLLALKKDPAARFADVRAFAAALAPFGPDGADLTAFAASPSHAQRRAPAGGSSEFAGAMTTPSTSGPRRGTAGVALLGVGVAAAVAAVVVVALFALGGKGSGVTPTPTVEPASTPSTKVITVTPAVTPSTIVAPVETPSTAVITAPPRTAKPIAPTAPSVTPTAPSVAPTAPPVVAPAPAPVPTPVAPPAPKPAPTPKPAPAPTDDPLHL